MPFPTRDEEWAPVIGAKGVGQIASNIASIIERDQEAALEWAGDGETLALFDEIHRARRLDMRFPFCAVYAAREVPVPLNEGAGVDETTDVFIEVVIADSDPDVLATRLAKYVRAAKEMIYAARDADMEYGLSNPTIPIWSVGEVDYGAIQLRESGKQGQYLLSARLIVRLQVVEMNEEL